MEDVDFAAIFAAIMEHSKDGLFVTDHQGVVLMVNQATIRMVEFEIDQLIGKNAQILIEDGYYDKSCALEVLRQQKPVSMIQYSITGRKILATGIPILGEDGEIRFVLVNDRDISNLEALTESLEKELLDQDLQYQFTDSSAAASVLQEFVVQSPAMLALIKTAIRAARYDLPLLITGASGVGKSMVARLTHRISSRKEGRFVDVNCGAIADSLIESELFGYEKGAFTGASAKGKKGFFELADNGTLFLDEIGEVPKHLQVKLLRFLEGGELVRVGGTKSIAVNTRIIAATNRKLEEMVADGSFRQDLYYRLNVVPLVIPPLAQRQEEIGAFVDFFLQRYNKQFCLEKTVSRSARRLLERYDYPGNVRELDNIMRRLIAMTEGDVIRSYDLPDYLQGQGEDDGTMDHGTTPAGEGPPLRLTRIRELERDTIKAAVEKCGSQEKAARLLGLSQSTISRKLRSA